MHAVGAKEGVPPSARDLFGVAGNAQLDALELPVAYRLRTASLRDLIAIYDTEVATFEREIRSVL